MVATLQGWRSYGSNEFFASSLATELTRFFPEAARFPLAGVSHTQDEFDVELDLERGFRATGRRAALEISGVLDRRQFSAPDFQLGPASACDEQRLPSVQRRQTLRVRRRMARRPHRLPRTARAFLLRVHGRGRVLGDVTAWLRRPR